MPAHTVRPDIPVLLLGWNTQAFTLRCIDSIADGLDDDTRVQEVVVENGSREALEARDDIERIVNEANRGYSAAVNQAYRRATGELVLLLNIDIVFLPGSLITLRRFLAERPDVARVSPLYLNPEPTRQQHHFHLPRFAMALSDASRLFARIPALAWTEREYRLLDVEFTEPRRLEQPSASVLLLRRSCLPDSWLMDDGLPIYYNDVELAYRLATAGHELWMTPDAAVIHDTAPPRGCWAANRPASTSARRSASCSGRSRRGGSCSTAPSSSSRSSGGSSSGARARLTGNPILAAVPDGDARDLLTAAGTGLLARPSDVGALAKLIEAQIDRRQQGEPAPESDAAIVSAFERRSLTRRLATVFGGVLGVEPAAAPVEAREIPGAAR
jgi:GT2 family glycosyltransferase